MNLHAIVIPFISGVNPMATGTIRRSTGYTTSPNGKQVPTYKDQHNVKMQIQPMGVLQGHNLEHLDSLNIQGTLRSFHINGQVYADLRPGSKGGDLIVVNGETWLVVLGIEQWDQSGWCRVIGQLQNDA